ncbi:MAG: pyrroline-5-carboxylate reductase family protein [Candidatus Competibacterales bacterium]
MPNTPALLGCGISALYANAAVTPAQRQLADAVLAAGGPVVWVEDEAALDAVTALSGGGPAYFFALMEYLERGGQALGLDAATARTLTLQTALGAARMALEDPRGPGALRAQVTSKAGTTERAIATFEAGGLAELVASALAAARDRARELGEQLGEDR